jgi:hypothetical protein
MTQAPTIPEQLVQRALANGWTSEAAVQETIQRALAKGFSIGQFGLALDMGLTPERVHELLETAPVFNRAKGEVFNEQQQEYIEELKKGRYSLEWLHDPRPNWGIQAAMRNPERGLTLQDINSAYAGVPEDAPELRVMAPRGSVVDDDVPDMGYTYNQKYQVWSDNVVALYEEACARQWSATRDIPWDELKPLPDDLERAQCQIATLLTEVEMIASDFPAKWLWQMNQHFHEVKMFLCTQAMDEARHLEVFRKRALANGGGLMRCLTGTEQFLKTILHAPTYVQGSFLMHVLGEGLVLDIFRSGEFLAKNKTEKEIYRLCIQDEARHVSYGTMHLKYFLEHHPEREQAIAEMHALAEVAELGIPGFLTNPFIIEPLAVLMGDGVQGIDKGMEAIRMVWVRMREEYLNRCAIAGFDRRDITKVPAQAPF